MRTQKRRNRLNESLTDMADKVDRDHEVDLARSELYQIADHAIKLHDLLKGVSEAEGLDAETQADITKAASHIEAVYHKLDYEMKPEDLDISDELGFDSIEDEPIDAGMDSSIEPEYDDTPLLPKLESNNLPEMRKLEEKLDRIFDKGMNQIMNESGDTVSTLKTATSVPTARKLNKQQVMAVQTALKTLGFNLGVDGIYGKNTANAVRSYQKANGLTVDGDAGSNTIKSIVKKVGGTWYSKGSQGKQGRNRPRKNSQTTTEPSQSDTQKPETRSTSRRSRRRGPPQQSSQSTGNILSQRSRGSQGRNR